MTVNHKVLGSKPSGSDFEDRKPIFKQNKTKQKQKQKQKQSSSRNSVGRMFVLLTKCHRIKTGREHFEQTWPSGLRRMSQAHLSNWRRRFEPCRLQRFVAQWKRAGLITQRAVDRNNPEQKTWCPTCLN